MLNHISGMPQWSIILFIISFLFSISFIGRPAKKAALDAGFPLNKAKNIKMGIFMFFVVYLLYVSLLTFKGFFDINVLPPPVMIWAALPFGLILFGYIGNTGLFKKLLQSVSLESLITLHIFRIVGIFFVIIYCYGLFPARFAFFAGLGDVITALFAWPVAKMASNKKPGWKIAVVAWNIFGIMDIVDLLIVAVLSASTGKMREIGLFPFVWFPAFAPAIILFLHTLVFRKLNQLKKVSPAMPNP